MYHFRILILLILSIIIVSPGSAQPHPKLVLTAKGVTAIRLNLKKLPLLKQSIDETIEEVNTEMAKAIDVPVPKDMAGGYTHEQHKKNYLNLQKAGVLFQITGSEKYANYVHDVLLAYAKLYPSLPPHPANRSYAPGKLFWQCLNDANWLVYMSQAYDCIYDWLRPEQRKNLEQNLFKPYADYLSIGSPQFFNRIHNHSTWGIAAVGMIGFVMNDQELIERALNGLKEDQIDKNQKDNDGGLIKIPGQDRAGFFAQLDNLFSPDGYYTEGPYYQRYALYPIMLFAESIENCMPAKKIFEYRNHILSKSLFAVLNLTDSKGLFFPINDSQKGMSWLSRELVSAVDIIYHFEGNDPMLLSIASKQNRVMLDDTGLSVAEAVTKGRAIPLVKKSMELKDGSKGDEGAVGIIRSGETEDELCLVMKYSAQGMGHGHFDKLSFSLYDKGAEVFQDYGAARYVNIDQKFGGAYLPENSSWAKQTIAHNTMVVNEKSHFEGNTEIGDKYHSDPILFDAGSKNILVMSAKEDNAYPGVQMNRSMVVVKDDSFEKPLVIDVYRVNSESKNQYDLPWHFVGQVMNTSFKYAVPQILSPLGSASGYQHLWKTGEGTSTNKNAKLSWFNNERFYTLTTLVAPEDQLLFARLGAKDPEFNLRPDPAFIIRKKQQKNAVFVSVIESHGHYDPINEIASNSNSRVTNLDLTYHNEKYSVITWVYNTNTSWTLLLSNGDTTSKSTHHLECSGKRYDWTGPYNLIKN